VAFEPGITGCPVLVGAAASFDCWLRQSYRAGDHLIVLDEVVASLRPRPGRTWPAAARRAGPYHLAPLAGIDLAAVRW
jgi:flavin reductase (DIM6/NTAB) family NADH-FMN oxidoreductase RutF